jgi:hypothetical protein
MSEAAPNYARPSTARMIRRLLLRLTIRLFSPLVIAWYLLTHSELNLQFGAFRIEARPKHRQQHFAIWGVRKGEDEHHRSPLLPKIASLEDESSINGEKIRVRVWRLAWGEALRLTVSSIMREMGGRGRFVTLEAFASPWRDHVGDMDLSSLIWISAGPIDIHYWRCKPRS